MNRVEFNLLPDLKMNMVKAARTRNTIISLVLLTSAASLAIFILLLFTTAVVQRKQLSDTDGDIKVASNTLKNTPNLEKILTVQNQLKSLTGLHQGKKATSRVFTYLPQVTPNNVSINGLTIDLDTNVMQISGSAVSQHAVNTFIDTLKFTTLEADGSTKNAFPTVIESDFAFAGDRVSYVLNVHFDPVLFSNQQTPPTLQVPSTTTTRSVVDNPSSLFTGQNSNPNSQER